MLRKFLIILLCLSYSQLQAEVQWASIVLGFSSEYSKSGQFSYRAQQALGKPNKLPVLEDSPCAWSPSEENKGIEWIHLGYNNPMQIQQVAIGENYNAGSIVEIILFDEAGNAHTVYDVSQQNSPDDKEGMFHVLFKLTNYKVVSVKVVLDTKKISGWNHIDAVAISDENEPVFPEIKIVSGVEEKMIEKLPEIINSPYDEVLPVISPDGKTLYFDRKNHPENTQSKYENDDIWMTTLNGSDWSEPIRFVEPLNNKNLNYVCSVTPDGNALLLGNVYEKDGSVKGGVSISYNSENGWSFPEELEIKDYYNMNRYSEFTMANNRKILLMSIETAESIGERDIFVSFADDDGKWSKPLNLGRDINTAAVELTPFLASDNKTLYFSSSGYSGYGGADMFVSRRKDDSWTSWTEPLNMGPLLNSKDWDISYTVDAKGEFAYFVSYANSNNKSADIFRVKLPEEAKPEPVAIITGKVLDEISKKPVKAEIIYRKIDSNKNNGIALSNSSNGNYKITVSPGEKYILWAKAKNYYSLLDTLIITNADGQIANLKKDLYLRPLVAGESISLHQVNFVQGEAFLLSESYNELNLIVQMMKDNETMTILLEGHTDISGNAVANKRLSEQRVIAVKQYLCQHDIEPERIKLKAYGESRPLTTERDPESRKRNRRVAFKILEL
ncbi:OmpA family protein [Chondrinema litorale]|uniref:OmpA family protein n=1 Tax=Chondrinema litorale TaxID=2994555 RepID=UPI002542BD62|nr:OmpA family protein [Chondrinema litorale]UZR92751.1 OmpA family protein [Chondrinema litorale]